MTGRYHELSAEETAWRALVGKRIRVWRVINGRSQDELADSAGVTRNFISAIERGAQRLDTWRLLRLAAAMGVPPAELIAPPPPAITNLASRRGRVR